MKVKEPVVSNAPPTNETLSCFTSAVCFSMTFVRHSIRHERQGFWNSSNVQTEKNHCLVLNKMKKVTLDLKQNTMLFCA